jgi:hypothetical protein
MKRVSSDVGSVEILNGGQGCHNLNRTTKHQLSPVQQDNFIHCLKKRKVVTVGQVNRFNSQ